MKLVNKTFLGMFLLFAISRNAFAFDFLIETDNSVIDIRNYQTDSDNKVIIYTFLDLQRAIDQLPDENRRDFIDALKFPLTNIRSKTGPVRSARYVTIDGKEFSINHAGKLTYVGPKRLRPISWHWLDY